MWYRIGKSISQHHVRWNKESERYFHWHLSNFRTNSSTFTTLSTLNIFIVPTLEVGGGLVAELLKNILLRVREGGNPKLLYLWLVKSMLTRQTNNLDKWGTILTNSTMARTEHEKKSRLDNANSNDKEFPYFFS